MEQLKKAKEILRAFVRYYRFSEKKIFTEQELADAIEYFAFNDLILKKKIEDVKSKYEGKYKQHKAVADKQFEEIGTRDCFDNELAISDLGAIRACEKLLEE